MRYEFRWAPQDGGRTILDVPAVATVSGNPGDWKITTIHLNGARVDGSLFEAVHDWLEHAGRLDEIDSIFSSRQLSDA